MDKATGIYSKQGRKGKKEKEINIYKSYATTRSLSKKASCDSCRRLNIDKN
jgi:hypothetical protein